MTLEMLLQLDKGLLDGKGVSPLKKLPQLYQKYVMLRTKI
jgi:hypothetical protein